MFRKIDHLTIYALVLTILSFLFIFYFHGSKANSLEEERRILEQKVEAKELGYTLAMASDYLTAEVRKFTITLNPIHLRNYWREVNVVKRRESVIKRMEHLKAPKEEFELLNQAKNNSDALVNTEILAQRLILEVYDVPEAQMEPQIRDYQLTQEDKELSPNQKVNKAREILYNAQYDGDKELIMAPIRKFQRSMEDRINAEMETTRERTDRFNMLSSFWMFLLTFLIFIFVYNVIQRIGTPLKDMEAQLKDNVRKVEVSKNSVAAITNITAMINKRREDQEAPDVTA